MKKIKVQKIRREIVEALIRYLDFAQHWAEKQPHCPDYPTDRFAMIMAGCILYKIRVRFNGKLASQPHMQQFTFSFDREEAMAFIMYFAEIPLLPNKLDKIMTQDFIGKIDKQLA